jgi:hypothetical protein
LVKSFPYTGVTLHLQPISSFYHGLRKVLTTTLGKFAVSRDVESMFILLNQTRYLYDKLKITERTVVLTKSPNLGKN